VLVVLLFELKNNNNKELTAAEQQLPSVQDPMLGPHWAWAATIDKRPRQQRMMAMSDVVDLCIFCCM
jgi:hypothetical protein